mmetsp:Transcript_23120/g.54663  ORF Transcript_23120/g.54663 Transcript_23120/m.54663 type:complete len:269 (+) Transcript_23120:127-933(+)|eukprot:CAMPEP_0197188662 /NCGR_PEP_ID=MMETSP1423-20130617/18237_1 /TAXON_ID=476441 /ORGANISM="Pseudo-nitzschia heimii, Strain UNC1101" /LENGTH=268 /DNA_ID=CAMNT_0042640557 /DNA_START=65 /DNA_END=871 /DNA_ORIENTATION=-
MPTITYKELMKTNGVSSSSPLNRALQMNEELESMRVKNVSLYDENQELTEINKELSKEREGLVQLVKSLNTELDQLKTSSVAKEKKLRSDLKAMQASWDSLYEEHTAAEERRKRELRLKSTAEGDRINQQAELLRNAVKKQSAQSDMVSPMEQRLHEMEAENKKLKSKVVQLQTKYKEEKYRNDNGIKGNDESASTTDSESVSSAEQKRGVSLLAGFSKRKVGQRPAPSTTRVPKFQTKNLWGRMTSPKSSRPEFEFSTINLAFSREE